MLAGGLDKERHLGMWLIPSNELIQASSHHENAQHLSQDQAKGVCVMSRACPKPAVVLLQLDDVGLCDITRNEEDAFIYI